MDDSAEDVGSGDSRADRCRRAWVWREEPEAPVGSGPVVVLEVLGENRLQVAPRQDEQMVEAVLSDRAHPALGERVGPRWQQHRIPKVISELSG